MKGWSDCKGQWAAMSSKASATHSSYPGKVTDSRSYSAPAKKLSHCHYRWQAFPWERLVRGTRAVWRMGRLHSWSPAFRVSWWLPSSAAPWGGQAIYSSDLRNGREWGLTAKVIWLSVIMCYGLSLSLTPPPTQYNVYLTGIKTKQ